MNQRYVRAVAAVEVLRVGRVSASAVASGPVVILDVLEAEALAADLQALQGWAASADSVALQALDALVKSCRRVGDDEGVNLRADDAFKAAVALVDESAPRAILAHAKAAEWGWIWALRWTVPTHPRELIEWDRGRLLGQGTPIAQGPVR